MVSLGFCFVFHRNFSFRSLSQAYSLHFIFTFEIPAFCSSLRSDLWSGLSFSFPFTLVWSSCCVFTLFGLILLDDDADGHSTIPHLFGDIDWRIYVCAHTHTGQWLQKCAVFRRGALHSTSGKNPRHYHLHSLVDFHKPFCLDITHIVVVTKQLSISIFCIEFYSKIKMERSRLNRREKILHMMPSGKLEKNATQTENFLWTSASSSSAWSPESQSLPVHKEMKTVYTSSV